VLHGRHLNEVSVSTVAELTAAVGNSAIDKILVAAGTYTFTADMCSGSAICIDRAVTIEAQVSGSVVLDGNGGRRVFEIKPGGTAGLVGLNITGGSAYYDGGGGVFVGSNGVANFEGCNIHDNTAGSRGGGLYIRGTATLTNTNLYSNQASRGGGVYIDYDGVANFEGCNIHGNAADDDGGGLYIYGTATLTNTNVYENQAGNVCSPRWRADDIRLRKSTLPHVHRDATFLAASALSPCGMCLSPRPSPRAHSTVSSI